jgi:hypothetical protein
MTGTQETREIKISKDAVDPADVETLQDLVLAAVNDALARSKELAAQKLERVCACEVMEKLRAHYDVDAVIRKRKPQSIATNGEGQHRAAGSGELERRIESHRRELHSHLPGNFPRSTGDVAKPCSDIEQRRLRR